MTQAAFLDNRAFLRLAGHDARSLLQGLVTSDLRLLTAEDSLYAALLSPQGKFQFAFHVVLEPAAKGGEEAILLEVSASRSADLERRLLLYRMRAPVTITPLSPQAAVAIIFGDNAAKLAGLDAVSGMTRREDGLTFLVEPRLAELGVRVVGAAPDIEAWLAGHRVPRTDNVLLDRHRIALAIPEPDADLVVDRTIMLEAGLDQLRAVAFDKGCFVGQELTARTHYRGLVKRRLVPVELESTDIVSGTPVTAGEREAGEIRSVAGDLALAMLRLDRLGEPLRAGGGAVHPRPAAWQADLAEHLREAAATH